MPGDSTDSPLTSATGLYCESYGSGDPILAIHGLGANLYSWRKLKGNFPGNRLVLIDLKGHGQSPKPRDKHYSIPEQAEIIHRFILEQDFRNLTLIGNSYGGAVSLLVSIRLCREEPGRLSKLILIDSGGYNQDLPWYLKLLRAPVIGWLGLHLVPPAINALTVLRYGYYDRGLIERDQIKAYAKPIGTPGGRHALLQVARQAVPDNFEELTAQYPSINVPTLILWGRDDKVIPLSTGEKLAQAIPDSRLVIIEQVGHVPQEEKADETVAHISRFLASS